MASGIVGSVILTMFLGAFTGVVPTAGFFAPHRRAAITNALAERKVVSEAPAPPASRGQWTLLGLFFADLMLVIASEASRGWGGFVVLIAFVGLLVSRFRRRAAYRRPPACP